jgi:DNA-binding response OmpR family regulator
MPLPTILVADNDETYLHTVKEFLETYGYRVLCASSPQQAKEILKATPIALAILDYRLVNDDDDKDKSGLRLAQETTNLNIPKIILTKVTDYQYAVDSLKPGKDGPAAVDFVMKQAGLEKLLDAIRQILTRARIFLCYADPDKDKVLALYDGLAVAGFSPWMDKKHLQGGEKWDLAIRRAIRSSDFFIVCLSANSVNRRGFMQKEIKIALNLWEEKLEDDIFMIPLRLEECVITHEKLLELQWVDLYRPEGFSQLVKSIQAGMRKRIQ